MCYTKMNTVLNTVFANNCKHNCLISIIDINLIASLILCANRIFSKAIFLSNLNSISDSFTLCFSFIEEVLIFLAEIICLSDFLSTYTLRAVFLVHHKLFFQKLCLRFFFICHIISSFL